jgi:hypothetical protein
MPELVTRPTEGILRFHSSAIERIVQLSACNPFYANRICNHLWEFMVGRKWKYVVADDVQRMADETIASDDSQIFSHFWMDGIWGQGPVQDAAVNSNRAILYAFGRLGSLNPNAVYFHLEDIKRECRYLNEQDIKKWLEDLISREVLERHSELPSHYSVRTPYFRLWLEGRGKSELYSSLDPSAIALLQSPAEEAVNEAELETLLGQGVRYRTGTVGVYEVRKFLKQFGSGDNQRLIYKLVNKLVKDGFITEDEVKDAASSALGELSKAAAVARPGFVQTLTESGAWKNVFVVVPSGHSVTSFQVLADIIRQKENLAKNQTGSAKDLLGFVQLHKKPVAVLLFDDVIGTGMTASAAIEEVWSILDKEDLTKNVACILFYAVVGFRDVVAYLPLLGLSLSAPKS